MEQYVKQGLISDSKVLDIRQVDVSEVIFFYFSLGLRHAMKVTTAKVLENEIPVFVVTFATQEVMLFRDMRTGKIVVGADDKVEQCTYAAVITRVKEELDDELTGGWKVIEVRHRTCM